jgi:type IV secretory pathway protease TraF
MRLSVLFVVATALPVGLAVASAALPRPLVLINPSPSVPPGLYLRSPLEPAVGRLLAFYTPRPGRAYAQANLPELDRGSILKPVAAGEGAKVCALEGRLSVDGRVLGPIVARDRRGQLLPHWTGCRRLGAGEYLVFSSRIWNSFDSRYYGPVARTDILGVYRPLWVAAASGPGA